MLHLAFSIFFFFWVNLNYLEETRNLSLAFAHVKRPFAFFYFFLGILLMVIQSGAAPTSLILLILYLLKLGRLLSENKSKVWFEISCFCLQHWLLAIFMCSLLILESNDQFMVTNWKHFASNR